MRSYLQLAVTCILIHISLYSYTVAYMRCISIVTETRPF